MCIFLHNCLEKCRISRQVFSHSFTINIGIPLYYQISNFIAFSRFRKYLMLRVRFILPFEISVLGALLLCEGGMSGFPALAGFPSFLLSFRRLPGQLLISLPSLRSNPTACSRNPASRSSAGLSPYFLVLLIYFV